MVFASTSKIIGCLVVTLFVFFCTFVVWAVGKYIDDGVMDLRGYIEFGTIVVICMGLFLYLLLYT